RSRNGKEFAMTSPVKTIRTFLVATIGLIMIGSQVSAESWHAAEGPCLDWTGTWEVSQSGPGTGTGRINYRHTGGDCIGPHDTLSLPKTRFERIDGVARQGSDRPQCLHSARPGV